MHVYLNSAPTATLLNTENHLFLRGNNMKVAVPTNNPGGLSATRSGHFGHCDLFTLVDIEDGKISNVDTLSNVEHQEGGCLVPVNMLKSADVNALVVGGMGYRPLMGFKEVGIDVYYAAPDVYIDAQSVLDAFISGSLSVMDPGQACGGGPGHHH
jgi:predicted Fe-Mo cluster-binding NifX family protein